MDPHLTSQNPYLDKIQLLNIGTIYLCGNIKIQNANKFDIKETMVSIKISLRAKVMSVFML